MWKSIPNFEKYEISSNGIIRNLKTKKLLKYYEDKNSYFKLTILNFENKYKNCFVHRLVALTFIKNYSNKPFVNHIDGNKQNNSVSNLEWVTLQENCDHAWKNNLMRPREGTKHHNCKLTERDIIEIKKMVELNVPRKEIAKQFNIHKNHIYRIKRGIRWKHIT